MFEKYAFKIEETNKIKTTDAFTEVVIASTELESVQHSLANLRRTENSLHRQITICIYA